MSNRHKRHHFVPEAYLTFFCNEQGKLWVYDHERQKTYPSSPRDTAVRHFYYSQPLSDGGWDDNSLEATFNGFETKWRSIAHRMRQRESVNDCLEDIFAFTGLQRLRVPATRDAAEAMLAGQVKAAMQQAQANGELPPPPEGLEHLPDQLEIPVDPHQSIHAMVSMSSATGRVFDRIGICAVHNRTGRPFLTSDNPVIWFDPSLPLDKMQPYVLRPNGPIMLFFPIAPDLMIYGCSDIREHFVTNGLWHKDVDEEWWVERVNNEICRFAYQTVFARDRSEDELIRRHADVSPVLKTNIIPSPDGRFVHHQWRWGKRQPKPKWKRRDDVDPE